LVSQAKLEVFTQVPPSSNIAYSKNRYLALVRRSSSACW